MKIKDAIKIAQGELGIKENPPGSNCVKYNDFFTIVKEYRGMHILGAVLLYVGFLEIPIW